MEISSTQSMFNITDGPSQWFKAGLAPFKEFYLYLTLKTANESCGCSFTSLTEKKISYPMVEVYRNIHFQYLFSLASSAYISDNTKFKVKDSLRINA